MEKKDNVGVNNKYIQSVKKDLLQKKIFLETQLIEINQKPCKFFLS